MEEIVIGVGGMSCEGCVKSVSSALQALPGVQSVSVSLEAAQVRVSFDASAAAAADFIAAIEAAGFDALPAGAK